MGLKKYPSIFGGIYFFYLGRRMKCIICPISIYSAQIEKNNLLVFPFVLNARIIKYINNGVAENAYSKRIMFIVGLYFKCSKK
jgi:hypothetical protein